MLVNTVHYVKTKEHTDSGLLLNSVFWEMLILINVMSFVTETKICLL